MFPMLSRVPTNALFLKSPMPTAPFLMAQLGTGMLRWQHSKSPRNQGSLWDGGHKRPNNEEQRQRRRDRRRPYVLGRDNVHRCWEPVPVCQDSQPLSDDQTATNSLQLPDKNTTNYAVVRTRFGQLPVYTRYQNGRSRITTVIRRIQGDAEELTRDLRRFLPADHVHAHPVCGHVIIKGNMQRIVRYWLTAVGF